MLNSTNNLTAVSTPNTAVSTITYASLVKKGTSGLVPKPKLDQVVGFTPASSTSYILGNENHLIEKRPEDIKRSTYCPNITCNVFKHLLTHPNARNLYLLGVKYSDSQGGDIQPGISETRHYDESSIDNAIRGIKEELHICIKNSSLRLFGRNYYRNHDHYQVEEIKSPKQYQLVNISEIDPHPENDNTKNKSKVSVYVFGTFENLLPILQAYQPPSPGSKHDLIDYLCMVPFSDLKNFGRR
jgi:hypothetical protein